LPGEYNRKMRIFDTLEIQTKTNKIYRRALYTKVGEYPDSTQHDWTQPIISTDT